MTRVRFTKSCTPYSTGEIAMFEDDRAEMLVDRGVATYVDEEKEASPKKRKRRSLGENRQVTTD